MRGSPLLSALLLVLAGATLAQARLVINEVMPGGAEFIELHNTGADPIDLEGHHLVGTARYTFGRGQVISPGGFLVLSVQGQRALQLAYGSSVESAGELSGRPSRAGSLRLFDRAGKLLDSARYRQGRPGNSAQRVDPSTEYRGPLNWRDAEPSPGRANAVVESFSGLGLDDLTYPRDYVSPKEGVPITARLFFDPKEEVRVVVEWKTRTAEGEVELRPSETRTRGWIRMSGEIPAAPDQSLVSFTVRALSGTRVTRISEDPLRGGPLRYFVFGGGIELTKFPLYCLELPTQEHTRLLERPERHRFPASFVAVRPGGVADIRSNVKIQVRGGSWTRNWLKRAWVLTFPKSQRFEGQRQINLRSGWHDPTMLRDLMGFEAFRRAGVPSPQARWVRVHINGRFCGVFTEVEMIDGRFLQRNGMAGGDLYQARPAQRNSRKFEKADGRAYDTLASYRVNWNKVTRRDEGYQPLRDFIEGYHACSGDELEAFFRQELDVERYVSYLAVTTFISHWDSLIKNFYWVHDTEQSGKWIVIPWDLDRTWGDHFKGEGSNADPVLLGTKAYMIAGNRKWWNRLRDRFLSLPVFKDMLYNRLVELSQGALESTRLIHEMRNRFALGKGILLLDREEWGFYERHKSSDGVDVYTRGEVSEAEFKHGMDVLVRYTALRSGFLRRSVRTYFSGRPRGVRRESSVSPSATDKEFEGAGAEAEEAGERDRGILIVLALALFCYVALGKARQGSFP
ncbi:MAG: CotH kinase family protein [Planctomycetes bacterium]|nr:CotH kinase family protein [Planctomycetota bacterium]